MSFTFLCPQFSSAHHHRGNGAVCASSTCSDVFRWQHLIGEHHSQTTVNYYTRIETYDKMLLMFLKDPACPEPSLTSVEWLHVYRLRRGVFRRLGGQLLLSSSKCLLGTIEAKLSLVLVSQLEQRRISEKFTMRDSQMPKLRQQK